jgi:hypothetical protein
MKKPILSIVTALTIILGLSIAGFSAIVGRVTADIPFDFTIGNKQFSPGKYTVARGSNTGSLVIYDSKNKQTAVFLVHNASPREDAKAMLVFNRYGDKYFLSQVWDGSGNFGNQLSKSKAERKTAKGKDDIVKAQPQTVTIMAQAGN